MNVCCFGGVSIFDGLMNILQFFINESLSMIIPLLVRMLRLFCHEYMGELFMVAIKFTLFHIICHYSICKHFYQLNQKLTKYGIYFMSKLVA